MKGTQSSRIKLGKGNEEVKKNNFVKSNTITASETSILKNQSSLKEAIALNVARLKNDDQWFDSESKQDSNIWA